MLRITTDDYLFTKSFFLMFSKKSIVFILSFVFVSFVSAQNNIPDTLTQAKQQIAKGNIKEANEMLVLYISKHPKELNTLWLNAQCNYWLNNFTAAKACYKNAMQLFPDNYYLQLDYAKMLIQIGAYNEGEVLLKKYLSYDPEDTTSLYYLAKLNYWQGNYNDALNWTKKIITKNPNHEGANNINTEIALLKGTQLEIKSSYYSDNQPMQILSDGITVSKHFNSIFSPIFSFQNTQITVHDTVRSANTFQLSNQFNLYKLKSVVTTSLGFIMSPVGSHNFIGSIAVEKKLTPRLSFSIAGEGYQYFISAESVSKNIVANKFAFTGSYNNKNFIDSDPVQIPHLYTQKKDIEIAGFFAAIFAWVVLKEHIKSVQWVFFLMAFIGVLIMKGFNTQINFTGFIFILISAIFSGLVYVLIRKIGTHDHPVVVVHYFMIIATLVGGVLSIVHWRTPEGFEWPLLLPKDENIKRLSSNVMDIDVLKIAVDENGKLQGETVAKEIDLEDAYENMGAQMLRTNPKFVLRNHLAEVAIRQAKVGDFSEIETLCNLLKSPFDEHPGFEAYADLPPDWAGQLEISCSS